VEILVALFIMALASAMVVMAMPARPDALDAEADHFADTLQRVLDQSITRGQAHGIRVEETSYTVYARVGGRWVSAPGGSARLPDGMSMGVATATNEADDTLPQIVADASGIVSGPSVRIVRGTRSREIKLSGTTGARGHD
jgi:type II secretory pathway pseudopilin PulG